MAVSRFLKVQRDGKIIIVRTWCKHVFINNAINLQASLEEVVMFLMFLMSLSMVSPVD